MKVTREEAIAFLRGLGFVRAEEWPDMQIRSKLFTIPAKVTASDLDTQSARDFLEKLSAAGGKVEITTGKGAKKQRAKQLPRGRQTRAISTPLEKDFLGSKIGTISAQVNKCLSPTWKDDETIAKESGVKLRQARARLYHAAKKGLIQYRRRIEYCLLEESN